MWWMGMLCMCGGHMESAQLPALPLLIPHSSDRGHSTHICITHSCSEMCMAAGDPEQERVGIIIVLQVLLPVQ
jgi:hypothetical protein